MTFKIILPAIFALIISCDKNNKEPKPAFRLLTQMPWILASSGIDDNRNDLIDPSEESIRDCEKDNRYNFYTEGKGTCEENTLDCGIGIAEMPFTWKLVNGDSEIDFGVSTAKILRLTEQELVICHEIDQENEKPLKFMTVFRH